jgi:hypothetical protein
VINAPDRARGKAVKCPDCGTAVRVPAAAAAPMAPAGKKAGARPPSSSQMIANLDLDGLEDTQSRICPKCGADVAQEDIECPECGVNLVTGTLSAKAQKERDRKGPNPKEYYTEFFSDSFEFWKKNKNLSIGLARNCAVFAMLGACDVSIGIWCSRPLARIFWWFMATVNFLAPPGLAWNLHTTIIDATLRKKKKLPKYHFDKLLGTALGLKLILWFLDVAAPLHIIAVVCLILRFPLVALGLEVAAVIFASLLFPLAMSHFAMPVTIRGWLLHKMSGPFFRTFPALAYWAMFLFLLMLVPVGCVVAGGVVWGNGVVDLFRDSTFNSNVLTKQEEIQNLPKTAVIDPELREWQGKKEVELNWNPFWIPSGLVVLAAGIFGATAVLLMRSNGLYTRCFLNDLDLETMEPEVKYVAKAARIDEIEGKKGLTMQVLFAGLGLAGVLAFAFGGAYGAMSSTNFLVGVGWGFVVLGVVATLVGLFWLMFEAYLDSMVWFGAFSLCITVTGSMFPFFGVLGFVLVFPICAILSIVYGAINWSNVKFPLIIELAGIFFYFPIGLVVMVIGGLQLLAGAGGGEAPQ